MTYQDNESRLKGQPVELYRFTNKLQVFYFTSADEEIVIGSETYRPHPIERDDIVRGRLDSGDFKITVPSDSPLAAPFKLFPDSLLELQVIRAHRDDLNNLRTIWDGELLAAEFKDDCVTLAGIDCLQMTCRQGLRCNFGSLCNNYLFDDNCGLDSTNYAVNVQSAVVAADGLSFSAPAGQPDNYFNGGVIFRGEGLCESRTIETQVGDDFTICIPFVGFTPGETIQLLPGCDRTGHTCNDKYNNLDCFKGFEAVPTRDPHSSFAS